MQFAPNDSLRRGISITGTLIQHVSYIAQICLMFVSSFIYGLIGSSAITVAYHDCHSLEPVDAMKMLEGFYLHSGGFRANNAAFFPMVYLYPLVRIWFWNTWQLDLCGESMCRSSVPHHLLGKAWGMVLLQMNINDIVIRCVTSFCKQLNVFKAHSSYLSSILPGSHLNSRDNLEHQLE